MNKQTLQLCRVKPSAWLILIMLMLSYSKAGANPQTDSVSITMHLTNAPIEKAFALIKQQTAYRVIYDNSLLGMAKPVTVSVEKEPLAVVLKLIFLNQPFDYRIMDQSIVITPRQQKPVVFEKDTVITGIVMADSSLSPLAGATIVIKGTSKYTTTDSAGNFQVSLHSKDATLVVSYVGYTTRYVTVKAGSISPFSILLSKTVQEMKEVTIVNTGYQSLPRERSTGSFTQVNNELLNEQSGFNIIDRLEGVASAVLFDKNPNRPPVTIRGFSSIYGSNNPLIVVDNFPYEGDINNINPNDIENITILKDAAAASIWGTRAGNGVIVITTKKGALNHPLAMSFNSNITLTGKPNLFYKKQISSADFIGVEQQLFDSTYFDVYDDLYPYYLYYPGLTPVVELLLAARKGTITPAQAQSQIALMKTHDVRSDFDKYFYNTSLNQQYALSMQGGNASVTYRLSGGYDKNLDNLSAHFNRVNLHSENAFKPFDNLQISTVLYYTQSKSFSGKPGYESISVNGQNLYPYAQLVGTAGEALPLNNYRQTYTDTAGGGKLLDWKYYPYDDYKHNTTTTEQQDLLANIGLQYKLSKSLSIEVKYQYEKQRMDVKNLQDIDSYAARNLINLFSQIDPNTGLVTYIIPKGSIYAQNQQNLDAYDGRAQLNFKHAWKNSQLNAIAGTEIRQSKNASNSDQVYGYDADLLSSTPVDYVHTYPSYVDGSSLFIPNNTSFGQTLNRYTSVYMNAAWSFKEKYTVSGSARKDESNLFGVNSNEKGVPLWSTGISWDMAKESFYKSRFLPHLRLRATYGHSGNVDNSRAAVTTLSIFPVGAQYTNLQFSNVSQHANPDLRWEQVKMLNLGVDFESRNKMIAGSIEYYHKKGIDLFGISPLDYTTGLFTNYLVRNVANMVGNGMDMELSSNIIDRKFKWMATLILNYQTNKVTKYYEVTNQGSPYVNDGSTITPIVGKPVYSILSYKWAGLDPANGNPQGYVNKQVSSNYSDITGSKTLISDLVYSGSAVPTYYGSFRNMFSWNNFTLTINISYKLGFYFRRESINYSNLINSFVGHSDFAKRWQKPGDERSTSVPSFTFPVDNTRDNFYTNSDVLVTKGDHIRLQFVNLAYTLSRPAMQHIPFKLLQLYINSNNLGILWRSNKYGIDPDYNSAIPPSKSFSFGIRGDF